MTRRERITDLRSRVARLKKCVANSHLRSLVGVVGDLVEEVHDLTPHALEIRDRAVGGDPRRSVPDVDGVERVSTAKGAITDDKSGLARMAGCEEPIDDETRYPIKVEIGGLPGDRLWRQESFDDDLATVLELRRCHGNCFVLVIGKVINYGESLYQTETIQIDESELIKLRCVLLETPLQVRT